MNNSGQAIEKIVSNKISVSKPFRISCKKHVIPRARARCITNAARLHPLPRPDSLSAEAMRENEPVLSVIYDAMLENDGAALLYFPVYNYSGMNLDVVHEMLTHPLALPGLSDGGAHVGTICDASFPTFLLSHWGRDRAHGRLEIERLVKMQAHDTARVRVRVEEQGRDVDAVDISVREQVRCAEI